ncbi:MAG: HD domain-containing protein [Desulfobacteraceae bacterium]|nr:HD domain-containing protein [Desulfobacteraceae bacterium]
MKKQFINTIKSGDAVDDIFVLSEKKMSQKKDGNNYLNISLSDKTGRVKGVIWDNVDQIAAAVSSGDLVHIKGNVSEYNGNHQLVIREMSACPRDSADSSDFIPKIDRDIDAMFESLLKLTDSMNNSYLKQLLELFWNDAEFVNKFKQAPAAKKMHHVFIGGLLLHSYSMAKLADKIASHYKGVDRDLLIAGAILHDIGKVRELEYKFSIDYSDEGRLLSHIVIGCRMIDEKILEIQDFPEEQALLLRHMIVSHHGSREFGSPEPPKTIEAVLLNYIDEIDARVNGIRDFISKEDSNETWTSFHRLLGRQFYKGKVET